jgi:hypothetical protein
MKFFMKKSKYWKNNNMVICNRNVISINRKIDYLIFAKYDQNIPKSSVGGHNL